MATSTYMQFGETYIGQKHILKKMGFEQEMHVHIANQIICLKNTYTDQISQNQSNVRKKEKSKSTPIGSLWQRPRRPL